MAARHGLTSTDIRYRPPDKVSGGRFAFRNAYVLPEEVSRMLWTILVILAIIALVLFILGRR